jgi:CRP-like cAMP-binding protein
MYQVFEKVLNDFSSIMESKHYKKGELIHENNSICDYLFLVRSGILRSYYYKDGKDITAHFAIDRGITGAIDSFIQRKKSRYNIHALEDSEVWRINYYVLEEFLQNNPQHERTARIFTQEIYLELAERVESIIFHDAQERYNKFMEKHPSIIQRVNLGYIASFLGIAQETLSRVRANHS